MLFTKPINTEATWPGLSHHLVIRYSLDLEGQLMLIEVHTKLRNNPQGLEHQRHGLSRQIAEVRLKLVVPIANAH